MHMTESCVTAKCSDKTQILSERSANVTTGGKSQRSRSDDGKDDDKLKKRSKKKCSYEGCDKYVQKGGVCWGHRANRLNPGKQSPQPHHYLSICLAMSKRHSNSSISNFLLLKQLSFTMYLANSIQTSNSIIEKFFQTLLVCIFAISLSFHSKTDVMLTYMTILTNEQKERSFSYFNYINEEMHFKVRVTRVNCNNCHSKTVQLFLSG